MRKLSRLVVMLFVGLSSGILSPIDAAEVARSVSGSIMYASDTEAARCAWLAGGSSSNGIAGYVIPILPDEAASRSSFHLFSTDPDGATGPRQATYLSYQFYEQWGSCRSPVYTLGGGAEVKDASGVIPQKARYVLITISLVSEVDPGLCFYYWVPFVFPCRTPSVSEADEIPAMGTFTFNVLAGTQ